MLGAVKLLCIGALASGGSSKMPFLEPTKKSTKLSLTNAAKRPDTCTRHDLFTVAHYFLENGGTIFENMIRGPVLRETGQPLSDLVGNTNFANPQGITLFDNDVKQRDQNPSRLSMKGFLDQFPYFRQWFDRFVELEGINGPNGNVTFYEFINKYQQVISQMEPTKTSTDPYDQMQLIFFQPFWAIIRLLWDLNPQIIIDILSKNDKAVASFTKQHEIGLEGLVVFVAGFSYLPKIYL